MPLHRSFSRLLLASACAGLLLDHASAQDTSEAVIRFSTPPKIELVSPRVQPEAELRTASTNATRRNDGLWNLQERAAPQVEAAIAPPTAPSPSDPPSVETPRDSLAPLQNRALANQVTSVNTSMSGIGTGIVPDSVPERLSGTAVGLPDGLAHGAVFQCVHWQASNICHFPLYFEDAMLERHGHVRFGRLQPWASGVKFFTTISLVPYLKTLQPTREPRYALGHYRAGSRAPCLRDNLPWDRNAAAVETLSLAGFFWAAPL